MSVTTELPSGNGGLRPDEGAVRLLFVERSSDYAALVCQTLEDTQKGRFQVHHADRLETARLHLEAGALDAVLVDLTEDSSSGSRGVSIDEASDLATRIPVIVLTGSEQADGETAEPDHEIESTVLERIARSRVPDEILRAVRSHRRLGPRGGADPIVLRDPLRACARVFARIRRTLSPR
jgi:DNA-binding NtrC family response regulator